MKGIYLMGVTAVAAFALPALVAVLSYLLGCINGAIATSHLFYHDDVRRHGSGNAGLTNFYRNYGAKCAPMVIAFDMLKAVGAVLLGNYFLGYLLGWGAAGKYFGALFCVIGHMFPVFYGFKGGKGILCSGACAGFALEFIVFYAAGIVLVRILKVKGDCSLTFILGYLVYFAVFELVIVPMTLKWVSLTAAAYIWAGIMALVICAAVICTIKKQRRIRAGQTETCSGIFGSISEIWKNHSVMIILAVAVVLLQCLIVIFYEDTTVDAAYYVGTVSTSVYTDTLGRYNPFNGAIQKAFQARYVFSAYPMHNAVWCRLLGIHPIVQAKQVMSCMNVVTANLIIYQIGKRLFDGNRKKADLMLVFVCVLQLFCGTIYSSGTFFFTRSYEGKAILANIAIPAVLMCAVWYLQEKNSRNVWIILFVTAVSALTFSGSAIIFPIVIAAGMAPAAVMNKRFSGLVYCAVCMLPSALYAAVFFVCRIGLLTLAAS